MSRRWMAAAALTALAGCGGSHSEPKPVAAVMPVSVTTQPAERVEWKTVVDVPGTIRATTTTTLSSRVMAYVQDVRVRAGDRVAAGQVVALVDPRELESGLAGAKAAQREAESGLTEADNGIASAQAQLTLARVTFERMKALFEKKSVSHQEFDEAQARLRTAEAAVAMAEARRAQLDDRIAQARQGVATASLMRGYAEIRAPFAGLVTERMAEPGQLATPGAPLVTIEREGAYRLEAPVEESMIGQVWTGQTVQVVLGDKTVDGQVTEIVPAVDAASRAFLVKASIRGGTAVRSGMFGRLRLEREMRQTITVPVGSVAERGALASVLTVERGVARQRIVTLGERRGDAVEVLSGLAEGEPVVHPRPLGLRDGSRVEVRR